jgi:hypothetical protein
MEAKLTKDFINILTNCKDYLPPLGDINNLTFNQLENLLIDPNFVVYVYEEKNGYSGRYGIDKERYTTPIRKTKEEALKDAIMEFVESVYPYPYPYDWQEEVDNNKNKHKQMI